MRLNPLVKALSRGTFLIDMRAFATYMPLVHEWYTKTGEEGDDEEKPLKQKSLPYAVSSTESGITVISSQEKLSRAQQSDIFDEAPSGSVAIIPVKGVVMKDDFCGEPGTATIARWVKQADQNPNIIGIVYDVDTGGGAVDGTGEAADVFEGVKTSKPAITFINGLMASAGYWLGAAGGREIYMSHRTAEAGSIGTMITIRDWRKAMEMFGVTDIHIMADDSKDKWGTFFSALDGDEAPMKIEILNPTNDVFLAAVKRNRGDKLVLKDSKEPLTGKVYVGENALKIGLIDGFKTFDECVERVIELHKESTQSTKNSNFNTDMKATILAAWTALLAKLGLESKDGKDVETTISQEQLEKINADLAKVAQLESDLQAAQTAKSEAENAKQKAEQALDAEKTSHQTTKQQLEEVKKTHPGAATFTKAGKEDKLAETDEDDEYESPLDKAVRESREEMGLNTKKDK
ncbi:S49 family peptidase [Oscillatoria amoena NRMC-F 0135]|nr:S49 family peptidase [Oscillatoria amoena NRMC-F 0135]